MGIFPYLWEFKESLPYCRKLRVFSKKWELSHFYRNFPIFMGIFPYFWEFEESLPNCRKLRVQQKMGTFPFL
jgi:hypothetical protein